MRLLLYFIFVLYMVFVCEPCGRSFDEPSGLERHQVSCQTYGNADGSDRALKRMAEKIAEKKARKRLRLETERAAKQNTSSASNEGPQTGLAVH